MLAPILPFLADALYGNLVDDGPAGRARQRPPDALAERRPGAVTAMTRWRPRWPSPRGPSTSSADAAQHGPHQEPPAARDGLAGPARPGSRDRPGSARPHRRRGQPQGGRRHRRRFGAGRTAGQTAPAEDRQAPRIGDPRGHGRRPGRRGDVRVGRVGDAGRGDAGARRGGDPGDAAAGHGRRPSRRAGRRPRHGADPGARRGGRRPRARAGGPGPPARGRPRARRPDRPVGRATCPQPSRRTWPAWPRTRWPTSPPATRRPTPRPRPWSWPAARSSSRCGAASPIGRRHERRRAGRDRRTRGGHDRHEADRGALARLPRHGGRRSSCSTRSRKPGWCPT